MNLYLPRSLVGKQNVCNICVQRYNSVVSTQGYTHVYVCVFVRYYTIMVRGQSSQDGSRSFRGGR